MKKLALVLGLAGVSASVSASVMVLPPYPTSDGYVQDGTTVDGRAGQQPMENVMGSMSVKEDNTFARGQVVIVRDNEDMKDFVRTVDTQEIVDVGDMIYGQIVGSEMGFYLVCVGFDDDGFLLVTPYDADQIGMLAE